MLTIRQEQWRALARPEENAFITKVVAHLERALPDECTEMGTGAVRLAVVNAIQQARSYDIHTEYDIVRFIDFQFVLGLSFDKSNERAHDILNSLRVPAPMRLQLIEDYLDTPENDHFEVECE